MHNLHANDRSRQPILGQTDSQDSVSRSYLDVEDLERAGANGGWAMNATSLGSKLRDLLNVVTSSNSPAYHSDLRQRSYNSYESMEYNPPNSAVYRRWLRMQPFSRSWDKWLIMALIGITVGLTSFLLQTTIQMLFGARERLGRFFLDWDMFGGYLLAWFFYVGVSAVMATLAALLVVKVAPAASSSGVPQIMAFLNGVRMPKILNVQTFVVKFWSCSLGVAAGLPIGPEGPLIHMGAILGAAVSGLHSTTLRFDLGLFKHLRGSKHKRDFVTAGVAAGVAAAFDAPLGGLLFAFEEVASFWHSHLGWQVFFCCTVAVLVQNLARSLDRELHHTGHFGFFNGNVTFEVGVEVYAHVLSIIPAALVGVICGVLAVGFTKVNLAIAAWRARVIKPQHFNRLMEVLLMTLVYVGVCMLLPHMFRCRATPCTVPAWDLDATPDCHSAPVGTNTTQEITNEDLALTPDPFTCPPVVDPTNNSQFIVHYNPMATLVSPLGEDTISRLFARGVHREFGYTTLLTMLAWFTMGAAWAAGMDISSGLFVPMLLIGAIVGRICGLVLTDILPVGSELSWLPAADDPWKWVDPGVFAVVGSAAFMGGVTRLSISLAAIMMEVSSDVQMLLPVLVGILCAKAVADSLATESYYHALMEKSHVPFLPPVPHTHVDLDLLTVRAVMADPVQTVHARAQLQDLDAALRGTQHNGFPVVQPAQEGLVCLGLITRHHLLLLVEAAVRAGRTTGLQVSYPELNRHIEDPLTHDATLTHEAALRQSGELVETEADDVHAPVAVPAYLPLSLMDHELDLTKYVNQSVYMVQEDFSLSRAYSLFTSMGIRHLVVVDEMNRVRGIVTRKDLCPSRLRTLHYE